MASSDSDLLGRSELPSYEERLASGPLCHIQLCCLLLALLYTAGVPWLTEHIDSVFYQQDEDIRDTCAPILSQWLQHIDTEEVGGEAMHGTLTSLLALLQPVKVEEKGEGKAELMSKKEEPPPEEKGGRERVGDDGG